jgi:hypothetical protein
MAPIEFSAKRIILAGGFALAVAAAPTVAAFAVPFTALGAPAASCPAGEEEDLYSGSCLPHTVPNSPTGGAPASAFGSIPGNPDLPSINGIPCTGANSGQCIGLQEDAPQFVQPPTSIDGGQ